MIKHFAENVEYEIPEKLRSLVVAVIIGKTEEKVDLTIPIFATGFPLIVNIFGEKPTYTVNDVPYQTESNLVVAGQIYNSRIVFRQTGIFGNLGLILHPTATYYLFHQPGKFFNNTWTRFIDSSPIASCELNKKLAQCSKVDGRVKLLFMFLSQLEKNRLPSIPWLETSVNTILQKNGLISQGELIDNAGVSVRHFRRVFKNVIGVPPKYFCKVIQLNSVFQLLHDNKSEKMHLLALDCGYYDQSHFINDFHKLIGNTPENFLQGRQAYIKDYMGRQKLKNYT